MKLLTASEMRALDRRAIEEIGIPGVVLMENAGRAAAEILLRRFAALAPGPVLVLAGKGNNGGDGYVIARWLRHAGWQVRTLVLAEAGTIVGDAAIHLHALQQSGGEIFFAADENALDQALSGQDALLVDALLGTGLTSDVRGLYAQAIDWINAAALPVLAVDIPSGIDATTGKVLGRAVRAELTVSFDSLKIGHAVLPGAAYAGELAVVDIGIPVDLSRETGERHRLVDAAEARKQVSPRPLTGHKGAFGHLLVIAGATGKSGAAAMAAEGGLRTGAGLVTVACPDCIQEVLAIKLTEAMTAPLPSVQGALGAAALPELKALWAGKKALAIGPGMGQGEETVALLRELIRLCPHPVVLDADAVNALAGCAEILLERSAPTVLTPHPGEMGRLAGASIEDIEADRIGTARRFAETYKVVLVLKGARTVTAFPDGRVRINGSGNPGMASGGMGDVLTGIIGALLAQGAPAEEAAALGVYLHGRAADRLLPLLGDAGMIATDLLRELPAARKELIDFASGEA
ncbi:MAG: NAD(P)H-hydrate dehydratase [Desulfuromonadales bacterium]|jgi:NAD(P)H-hydrate epimerase